MFPTGGRVKQAPHGFYYHGNMKPKRTRNNNRVNAANFAVFNSQMGNDNAYILDSNMLNKPAVPGVTFSTGSAAALVP